MDTQRLRATAIPVGVTAVVLYGLIGVFVGYPCVSTGLRYGVWLDRCPATDKRLQLGVGADGVVRGATGSLWIRPELGFLEGKGPSATPSWNAMSRGWSADVELRDAAGNRVDGAQIARWKREGDTQRAELTLPEVPDGDYTLHVAVDAGFEQLATDLALPLYAPAIVHLATDRALYKPGQEVLLRSVVLRRTDLTPIDARPGKWTVRSPAGEDMLVERDPGGPWGVADSSFPLAQDAETGVWTATYTSGSATDTVTFKVEPFRLPRFTVELAPDAPWYRSSDAIVVKGTARYTSGAPIPNAPVRVDVTTVSGRWPMPLAWEEPIDVRTDATGAFTVDLGVVPGDLIEKSVFGVRATVTEAAGESGAGSASIVLSHDPLTVDAVTELGDGLVEGFNNRVYLRVTSPDGAPVRDTDVTVANPWLPDAPVRTGRTDQDGVAAIQLDPGAPVTVVDPAPPMRVRPMAAPMATLNDARELGRSEALTLLERSALDALVDDVGRCSDFSADGTMFWLALQVSAAGAVGAVESRAGQGGALTACVEAAHRGLRLLSGPPRTYTLAWQIPASTRPSLQAGVDYALGGGYEAEFDEAALAASPCVPPGTTVAGEAYVAHFRVAKGSRTATVSLVDSGLLPGAVRGCVERAMSSVAFDEPAGSPAIGVVRLDVHIPYVPGREVPQPTTRIAYELRVAAGDRQGRVVLPPGDVPPLRIRATPSLAAPGDVVELDFIRGPGFSGALPEEIRLWEGTVELAKTKLDPNTRKASFTIPPGVDGFLRVEEGGARAVIYARRPDPLALTLATERPSYRPGELAKLLIGASANGAPVQAGIGLVGVDTALSQLAPLLAPDDWGRVTVRATADQPAFGSFDPVSLALGQIAGTNAAQAAVLRLTQLPMDAAGDDRIAAQASAVADLSTPLILGFWRAYAHAAALERAWEATAPPGETLAPERMVTLWDQALAACAAEGKPAVDAFGRPLTLPNLPPDLLAELDPRRMVSDGARLTEDVVDWPRHVAEEVR